MSLIVGNNQSFYYNVGTNDIPIWVLIPIVGDVTLDQDQSEAEVDLRISSYVTGLPAKFTGVGISFFLAMDHPANVWTNLNLYFHSQAIVQYAVATGPIATPGTGYWKGYCHFTSFPNAQPTQEISSHDATLRISHVEDGSQYILPSWNVTV